MRPKRPTHDRGGKAQSASPRPRRRRKDALAVPQGIETRDVHRSLDYEQLRDEAPDIPQHRVHRIAKVREELREGTYVTPERLRAALGRALEVAAEELDAEEAEGATGDDAFGSRGL